MVSVPIRDNSLSSNPKLQQFAKKYDADKNGKLDAAELKKIGQDFKTQDPNGQGAVHESFIGNPELIDTPWEKAKLASQTGLSPKDQVEGEALARFVDLVNQANFDNSVTFNLETLESKSTSKPENNSPPLEYKEDYDPPKYHSFGSGVPLANGQPSKPIVDKPIEYQEQVKEKEPSTQIDSSATFQDTQAEMPEKINKVKEALLETLEGHLNPEDIKVSYNKEKGEWDVSFKANFKIDEKASKLDNMFQMNEDFSKYDKPVQDTVKKLAPNAKITDFMNTWKITIPEKDK